MPLFFNTATYVIKERQHELNAEVLDGRLELLPNNEHVYIVAHHPNKQWSYNIGWIDEGPLSKMWEQVNALGHMQKIDKPHLYYEAIPKRFYKAYQELFKFQDLQIDKDPKKPKKLVNDPKPNIIDMTGKKPVVAQPRVERSSNSGDPKLQYPNERATYTYRPPSKR